MGTLYYGSNDMIAYLAMMSLRLVELRRALKSTGSLYLQWPNNQSINLRVRFAESACHLG